MLRGTYQTSTVGGLRNRNVAVDAEVEGPHHPNVGHVLTQHICEMLRVDFWSLLADEGLSSCNPKTNT
jgi:hypothetical protein